MLSFSLLCEMDGNNSLKQMDMSFHEQNARHDKCAFQSDYWVTPEEVATYVNEAKVNSVGSSAE